MTKELSCIFILACLLSLLGCGSNNNQKVMAHDDSTFIFHHEPSNAVYYWKTVLDINGYEAEFMKQHHVGRMYVKFFDVSTDNMYDGKGLRPVPVATTIFSDTTELIKSGIEIVPVVFITVEALQRKDNKLSKLIAKRVDDMCKANHISYREIQLDCDWTRSTKDEFFKVCQQSRRLLHQRHKGLSATIRLHQLRDTLPDIDYGVLMLYNTESFKNPKVKNSIINSDVVKEYMRHAKADKHLDFAYPAYEWTLLFKDNQFVGIIPRGAKVKVDGIKRHESSSFKEIMESKRAIKSSLKDIDYPSSTIIYHLDSANLSKYSSNEIEQIYHR